MCKNNYYDGTIEPNTDIYRIINKFDVYQCDLGEITENRGNTLGKVRPCVIVSSDDINCIFSNQYVVIPIRTIHDENINENNIHEYIEKERSMGRICVPIKFNNFSVLDINQIRQIPLIKIFKYMGSIVNTELQKRINSSIMELLFAKYELVDNKEINNIRNTNVQNNLTELELPISVEEIEYKPVEITQPKSKRGRKSSFPIGLSKYFELYMKKQMTVSEIAQKIGKSNSSTNYYLNKYKKLHPEICKKYNKEIKRENKGD